jgi:hypothetical protein
MSYEVVFERIGRQHNPPSITVDSDDPNTIAWSIFKHARKYLVSSEFEVTVDLKALRGSIVFGRFGEFALKLTNA